MKSGMLHLTKAIASVKIPHLYGSDPDGGEGNEEFNNNSDAGNGQGSNSGGDDGDDGDNRDGSGDEGDKSRGKTSQERRDDRARERASALEAENEQLRNQVKEFEDSKKSEIQKAQDDLQSERAANQALNEQLDRARIENAFLADNDFAWHNSGVALRLLDLDGIEIKDGKVTGMAEAIKELAESHPYLLSGNTGGEGQGKGDENGGDRRRKGASGGNTNNSGGGGNQPSREQMEAKYPALRR